MRVSENFVSRWARLKRNADPRRRAKGITDTQLSMPDVSIGGAEAANSQPQNVAATTDELFDPAGLPSIEAITANTDIRGFLQSRVPAELTRAALRQTWASDPAIRDFIGIAENQWDFNDPNAIPGFGQEQDCAPALLAQALGIQPVDVIMKETDSIDPVTLTQFETLVQRRLGPIKSVEVGDEALHAGVRGIVDRRPV